jgi:rRNA maturation protein Nop10
MTEEEKKVKKIECNRLWRESHKEHIRESNKQYRETHKEKVAFLGRRWRLAHPDKFREYSLNWIIAHPEKAKESVRRWQENNPGAEYAQSRVRKVVPLAMKCERCGGEARHRHHPDYSEPLKVMHLCVRCHSAIHREARRGK